MVVIDEILQQISLSEKASQITDDRVYTPWQTNTLTFNVISYDISPCWQHALFD